MLVANVHAKLDATREDLEQHERDLKAINKLIVALQTQETTIRKEIDALECKIMDKKIIARVKGITGNVKVRDYYKVATGADVAAIETSDAQILYVDTHLIEVMEVNE